jgi:golgi apparatus protein 1
MNCFYVFFPPFFVLLSTCCVAGMHPWRRFDAGVVAGCSSDVETFCAAEKSMLRGKALVLKCLVRSFSLLSDTCQSEMSRAVRLALWDYKPSAPLTDMCDFDVGNRCPQVCETSV